MDVPPWVEDFLTKTLNVPPEHTKVVMMGAVGGVGLITILLILSSLSSSSSSSSKSPTKNKNKGGKSRGLDLTSDTGGGKSKKKKKKKGGGGGAKASTEKTPPKSSGENGSAEPPTTRTSPEEEEEGTSENKKKKKKKRKKAKKGGGGASNGQQKQVSIPTVDEDSDDSDDELDEAARLMALRKKPSKKTFGGGTTPKPPVSTTSKKKKKATTPTTSTSQKPDSSNTSSSQQQQPASDPTLTISLGSLDPAILIGRGGSTIQNIQTTTSTKLDILKNTPSPGQNQVRITSADQSRINMAVEMVQDIIRSEEQRLANQKTVTLRGESEIRGSDGVKAIIGRGGATIKDIMSQCDGVKIDADVSAGTVTINGPKDLVDEAVRLCKNAVFGERQDVMELGSRSAVNVVFGKDFATIRNLQDSTGAKFDIEKGGTTLKLSGTIEEVASAREAVTTLLDRCGGATLELKASDVGAIYGKAGANIRNIQDKTGAFVEVEQLVGASGTTASCIIMGEPAAVEEARKMLQKAIDREVDLKPGEILLTIDLGVATPAVIGRGGTRVKELEQAHGVSINVNSDSGICRIVGKDKAAQAAKTAINAIAEPIQLANEARKAADLAVESGDTVWQASDIPYEGEGW